MTESARAGVFASLVFAFSSGACAALQATVNSRAAAVLGGAGFASVLSFSVGCALLTACAPFSRGGLWWRAQPSLSQLLPGALGAAWVTLVNALSPRIGYALFFVAAVVAQLFTAAALDALGWGGGGGGSGGAPKPATPAPAGEGDGVAETSAAVGAARPAEAPPPAPRQRRPAAGLLPRALSLCAAAAGVGLAVADGASWGAGLSRAAAAGCVLGAAAAGVLIVVQSMLNRSAAAALPSRFAATWWSFHLGVCACVAIAACEAGAAGAPAPPPALFAAAPWWAYLGGALGVVIVFSSIAVTQALGSQVYFTAFVCGQLATSCAIDGGGWLGAPLRPVGSLRAAGVALVALACVGAQLAR